MIAFCDELLRRTVPWTMSNVFAGRSIGSTLIDIDFHEIIFARLQKIQEYLREDPEDVAERMVRDKFERIKCSFGTPVISTLPRIPLEIPGLAPGHNYPEISIEDSKMIFTQSVLVLITGILCIRPSDKQQARSSMLCLIARSTSCFVSSTSNSWEFKKIIPVQT